MNTFELGDFPLAAGGTIPGARLAYQTFGELNADKTNAILFTTFLGAPPEVLNGWIGEGRALDPRRYFIILPGHFGLPPSSAPSNTAAPHGGAVFPAVSSADDVIAQQRLVTEVFGIQRLHLILGWSVGALQVYEWALRFGSMVSRIAPIAGAPTPPPWTRLWLSTVVEEPITSDPNWDGGHYRSPADVRGGLTRVAHAAAVTAPPRKFYFPSAPGWQALGFDSVDAYVEGFWENFWTPQDPNDVVVQARKARGSYPGPASEPIEAILGRIAAVTTIAAFTGDQLFPPEESRFHAERIPQAQFTEIESDFGHLATFGLSERDVKAIDDVIRQALDRQPGG